MTQRKILQTISKRVGYCCPIQFEQNLFNKSPVNSPVHFSILLTILNRTTVSDHC